MKTFIALAAAIALVQPPPLTKAEQLQEAARKGDAATVKKLLDEGVDVNTKFRYGATAIFYASDHGHVEVVKVLLDKGADLNLKDTFYGFTPLALALGPAQKKKPEHTEIAKLLIAKGSPGKEIALNAAIQSNDAGLAKVVLDSGGVPASTLSDALDWAKSQNKPEMATLLEQAGAKPGQEFAMTPEQLATFAGSYRNPTGNEITVVVNGSRLTIGPAPAPPAQRFTLIAKDATTFRVLTPNGGSGSIVFKSENDKITGATMTLGPNNIVLTRVEGK
jgi:ankyrin repeat protein